MFSSCDAELGAKPMAGERCFSTEEANRRPARAMGLAPIEKAARCVNAEPLASNDALRRSARDPAQGQRPSAKMNDPQLLSERAFFLIEARVSVVPSFPPEGTARLPVPGEAIELFLMHSRKESIAIPTRRSATQRTEGVC
jgi:hypothetical protein